MATDQLTNKILQAYTAAEPHESWKVDHKNTMAVFELEATINWGNSIFHSLSEYDATLHATVNRGQIPYDEDMFEAVRANYRTWLEVSESWLSVAEQYGKMGCEIRGIDRFRENCERARSIFVPDDQFFKDKALTDIRDKAIEDHRNGRTVGWTD